MVWVWVAVPLIAALVLLVVDSRPGARVGELSRFGDDHHSPDHAAHASAALARALADSFERCQERSHGAGRDGARG